MKQLIITAVVVLSSFLSKANDKAASPLAVASFQQSFSRATEISWTEVGDLYKVSFLLEGKSVLAYYNADGELIAVTQHTSFCNLPQSLQTNLKKEMTNGWITELFVLSTPQEGATYYVCIETADTKQVLRSSNDKKWSVYKNARL